MIFDILMPFYVLMEKYLLRKNTEHQLVPMFNFMVQYESTKTLAETLFESFPGLRLFCMSLFSSCAVKEISSCTILIEGDSW